MKINFTKKEYQTLVEMLLVADWVIRGNEDEPREETESYGMLRKKVLAHFKEMGMEENFEYDPNADEYFETPEYETQAPHMQFIEAYDEASFWGQLAEKLAARDFAAQARTPEERSSDAVERLANLFEINERYENEFAEHGLTRVHVVTDPTTRKH
jgi:hypothetical protein